VTGTVAAKIIASHLLRDGRRVVPSERTEVSSGELVEVVVDTVLANDITAPLAIREFRGLGVERVFDPEAIILVNDHFAPNKDIASAEQCRVVRAFAREQGIKHFYDVGAMGIEHVLLPEQGLVAPGDLLVGADSHTCTYGALGAFSTGMGSTDIAAAMAAGATWLRVPETVRIDYHGARRPWVGGKDLILQTIGRIGVDGARYRAIEFGGPAIEGLDMAGRLTMANMAVEAGAKAGLFPVDAATRAYLSERCDRSYTAFAPEEDASYARSVSIDVGEIEPLVACPHLPENVRRAADVTDVEVDQVVIGSCTNGRLEDLRVAAEILRGRRVHAGVRCVVIPGTPRIALAAIREGLIEAFLEAGAAVSTPTCGPCLGGHMGVLAAGERAVSTTNRNFVGRMGHPTSEVYLAGPAVAAASAVTGRIASPTEVVA